jgi:hypothetical protein
VEQRAAPGRAGRDRGGQDPADDDAAPGGLVHGFGAAFDSGQGAVEQGRPGDRAAMVRRTVELSHGRAAGIG